SLRDRPLAEGETSAQRRADVLVEVVVRAAQGEPARRSDGGRSPADRHLVVINVDAEVLAAGGGSVCELDGGPGLPAEAARRVAARPPPPAGRDAPPPPPTTPPTGPEAGPPISPT